jgi:hypothetical protein
MALIGVPKKILSRPAKPYSPMTVAVLLKVTPVPRFIIEGNQSSADADLFRLKG